MSAHRIVKWPKLLLFGDSLTQCRGLLGSSGGRSLSKVITDVLLIIRRADIVVRGFSGYNTRQCRALLPHIASDLNGFVAATIFLGANDASQEENAQQSVPIHEYSQNLKDIIRHFQNAKVSPVVITPPALDGRAWQKYCGDTGRPFTKEEEITAQYAQACAEAAASLKVPCVDLYTAMINQADWRNLLCDGLHFSRQGSEFLASLLVPTLERVMSGRVPSHPLLPPWDSTHRDHPATTFAEWCAQHTPSE